MEHRIAVRSALIACTLMLAGPGAVAAAQGAPLALVPHRAIYDLSLAQTRGHTQIAAATGRIVYDFSGSVCQGYSLNFRQVSELETEEGKVSITDLRSVTWESADGNSYKFSSQNYVDDKLIDSVEGRADHKAESTAVELKKPASRTLHLSPDVVFPTEHMVRAIEAGRAGKNILSFPVYDGSEAGTKIFDTLTVIGRTIASGEHPHNDAAAHEPKLAGIARWPVTISYFSRKKDSQTGEQTPDYAIGFELYANGISRALRLDYNDFVIAGKLVSLRIRQAKPCP